MADILSQAISIPAWLSKPLMYRHHQYTGGYCISVQNWSSNQSCNFIEQCASKLINNGPKVLDNCKKYACAVACLVGS